MKSNRSQARVYVPVDNVSKVSYVSRASNASQGRRRLADIGAYSSVAVLPMKQERFNEKFDTKNHTLKTDAMMSTKNLAEFTKNYTGLRVLGGPSSKKLLSHMSIS